MLDVHEEFIGLYDIRDTKADTLVKVTNVLTNWIFPSTKSVGSVMVVPVLLVWYTKEY